MLQLGLTLDHRYSAQINLQLEMAHENYTAKNFSTDDVDQSTMRTVIALGDDTADYSVNWLLLSLRYRF